MARQRSPRRSAGARASFNPRGLFAIALVLLIAIAALGGGSSRDDVAATIIVRGFSVILLAVCIAFVASDDVARLRRTLLFPGAVALVIVLQLVPLPHAIWSALPGRDLYDVGAAYGLDPAPWRPISLTPDLTLNALLALLPPTAAAVGMLAAGSEARLRMIALFAVIAGASAVLGLTQLAAGEGTWLRYYEYTNETSAVGIFANRNHQAVFLACALPLLAGWAALAPEGRDGGGRQFVAALAAGLALTTILVTGSRAGVLLAIPAALGSLVIYLRSRPVTRRAFAIRWQIWAPIAAFFVILLGALIFLAMRSSALERLLSTDTGDEQRVTWFGPLSEMAGRFMPFGSGFGSFASIFRQYEPLEMLAPTYLNEAHNDLMQILIEGGVVALILLGAFLIWWMRRSLAVWTARSRAPDLLAARVGSLVIGILLVASLFDYPLRTPFLAIFFAVAAIWLGTVRLRGSGSPLPPEGESV